MLSFIRDCIFTIQYRNHKIPDKYLSIIYVYIKQDIIILAY